MTLAENHTHTTVANIAANTASTSAIVLLRMACQAVVLVLSARLLGVDNYGIITAVVAIALLLGPWSGVGCDFLAMRSIARDPSTATACFWRGLRLIAQSAVPIILVAVALAGFAFGGRFDASLVAVILVAELLLLRPTELIAKIFQGLGRYREMALTRLLNSLTRLMVLAPLAVAYTTLSPRQWGWAYLVAAVASTALAMVYVFRRAGIGSYVNAGGPGIRDGAHFASGITSARMSSEFDKALVLALAGSTGAGIYGAGYRLISLAVAPVISFVNVVVTSLFRLRPDSQRAALGSRSLTLSGVAIAYGAIVGMFIWLFLPDVAARVLGSDFRAVDAGLVPLALLPMAISCRLVGEQAMAALDHFRRRTSAQWLVAGVAVILNLLLIPAIGWTAAVWVLLFAETMLTMVYLGSILGAHNDGAQATS